MGVVSTLLVYPPLSDKYGRKIPYLVAQITSAIGQLGLLLTNNIYEAYFYLFLIGTSFSGKMIVGFTYMLEFSVEKYAEIIIFLGLLSESLIVIAMTAWYQFIDRSYLLL